jgi:uncharacterized membrane protein
VELFNDFFEPFGGWAFMSRFAHVLSGITWIGLLYFFNFVQVPAYAELSDGARSEALRKLTFRALWWFRYAALFTFLFGISIISVQDMETYFEGAGGTSILTGMLFGFTMFVNVWGIIWRNQKIVIGNAENVAAGGEANPAAPAAAKKAARASRTNTLFSMTMLWFMVFTAHGVGAIYRTDITNEAIYWIFVLVIWGFIELSALGFIGGIDSPFNKLAFDSHKNTIIYGFVLLAIIYFVGWELILPA